MLFVQYVALIRVLNPSDGAVAVRLMFVGHNNLTCDPQKRAKFDSGIVFFHPAAVPPPRSTPACVRTAQVTDRFRHHLL